MSKYEERAYHVGSTKLGAAEMKNQLARLKHDLAQFVSRKTNGTVVASLQERIRQIEAAIAEAEADSKRNKQAQTAGEDSAAKQADKSVPDGTGMRATSGRFPPRGRPGR